MTASRRRVGALVAAGHSMLLAVASVSAEVSVPTTPRTETDAADVRATAQSIATENTDVTEMRRKVAGAFGARPSRSSIFSQSLVDRDPRYRENLVMGLKVGIVSLTAPGTYRPYVWGGSPTNQYPYVVAVVGSREICTGVVLNGNTVLTAAHCFCNNNIRQIHTGSAVFRGSPVAVVGTPKSMSTVDCHAKDHGRDVGLLYLPMPTNLPSARLATPESLAQIVGRQPNVLRIIGYGLTQDGGLGAKNFVDLPVASVNCGGVVPLSGGANVSDKDYYGCLPNQEMVAGAVNLDQDACGGDSGAPLLLEDGAEGIVVALSSRSVSRRRACGDGGIYSLVDGEVTAFIRSAQAARP